MKIAASQIEDLYAFTRAHFVEWYDLQTELVDHLANDIEAIWQEQPTLSYTEARDFSFKNLVFLVLWMLLKTAKKQWVKHIESTCF